MAIKIGCGSWADPEYTGLLYPPGLPPKQRLATYATRFDHVEVNSSYYATPRRELVDGWVEQTPAGFTFDIKLHRAFSAHPEKTARDGDLIERLLAAVAPLVRAKKLGAFLLMLAPDFSPDQRRLEEIEAVREKLQPHLLAVELRHSDWVNGANRARTLDFFRAHKLAWVAVDMPRIPGSTLMPPLDEVTDSRLAYLRLHGRNPDYLRATTAEEGHTYNYGKRELAEIVARIGTLARGAANVHVVANNHARDFAPRTALALQALLAGGGKPNREE